MTPTPWLCPACSTNNPAGMAFCGGCGQRRADSSPTLGGDHTRSGTTPRPASAPDATLGDAATYAGSSSSPVPTSALRVGRDARYELIAKLGEGGMGAVWKARDLQLGREVAIKRILGLGSAMLRERFQRETQALLALHHPNIVHLYDAGEDDYGLYLAMELVVGRSLPEAMGEAALPEADAVQILLGLCKAMAHAHRKGVVHRDIKPSNVMLDEDGTPRLLDFGLVRMEGATELSLTGVGMGTLDYAAPEQREDAGRADARSDIYALGLTFYQMLTGKRPVPLSLKRVPEAWRAVVERACEVDPGDRFGSVEELAAAVREGAAKPHTGGQPQVAVGDPSRPSALPKLPIRRSREDWDQAGFQIPPDAREDAATGAPTVLLHKLTGARLLLLPAGEFLMGSPEAEMGRFDDEALHRRTIREPFYLGQTTVTQSQWERVMGSNPSFFRGADQPVESVSWNDCQEFLRKAGGSLRLPSEAEWEYACRAGTTTPFSFGATITPGQVNYNGNLPYGNTPKGVYRQQTVACRSLPANAWGLYEMQGNVWEWCQDVHVAYPGHGNERAWEHGAGARVLRGGSWRNGGRSCRAAYRFDRVPDLREADVGLRLAWSLPE